MYDKMTSSKRLPAEARRASIIQHSKTLFAKYGLAGVSVNELARACYVNPAVLYQHFPSKEDLYRAVLEEFACTREDYVDAILTGPDDFGNVLYRMTLIYARSRTSDSDILRIELRSIIEEDEISDTIFANQWKGFTDYIETSLQEMIDAGRIPPMDLKFCSMTYIGMVREMLICHVLGTGEGCAKRTLEYLVKQITNSYLRLLGLPELDW